LAIEGERKTVQKGVIIEIFSTLLIVDFQFLGYSARRKGQIPRIDFTMSESCYFTEQIYNSAGILVRTLVNNALSPAKPEA
jgi:hypothetical protein